MTRQLFVTCCLGGLLLLVACEETGAGNAELKDGNPSANRDTDTGANNSDVNDGGENGTADVCDFVGETGLAVGDLAPDVTLYQCDGTPVQLLDIACDHPFSVIYSFSGW